jgi:hypothetical protein
MYVGRKVAVKLASQLNFLMAIDALCLEYDSLAAQYVFADLIGAIELQVGNAEEY